MFGAPVAQEDHAERALHAALAIRRRLHARFGDEVSLRIGVATGEAVVGEGRPTAGKPVASAARFAHATPAGTVCVGRRAAATARGAFEYAAAEDPPGCRLLLRELSVTRARTGAGALVNVSGNNALTGGITLTGASKIGALAGTLTPGAINGSFGLSLDIAAGATVALTSTVGGTAAPTSFTSTGLGTLQLGTTIHVGSNTTNISTPTTLVADIDEAAS